MTLKPKTINLKSMDDLEKIEEDVIKAAEKSGKKNVIVNIFAYPAERLKRRWHVRYKFNKKHLAMDAAIAAAILFLIGLNIFWLWGGFHYFTDKLRLEIVSSSADFASGREVSFIVNYANDNKFELQDFVLSFRYPELFELTNVSRADYDYEHNIILLGNLKPGANGRIEIAGRVYGNIGTKQIFAAGVNYYKTDKKSQRLWGQFSGSAIFQYAIADSFLKIKADLPARLVNKQIYRWPVAIENTSVDITYDKIILAPVWAGNRIESEAGWAVGNFAPGARAEFTVPFDVAGDENNRVDVSLSVIWYRGGQNLTQAVWSKDQEIFDSGFDVRYELETAGAVMPGEGVPIKIYCDNKGKYTIENLRLKLILNGDYWQMKNIPKGAAWESKSKTLVWDYHGLPGIALIQPGKGRTLEVTAGTREYAAGSSDLSLGAAVSYSYRVEGQDVEVVVPMQKVKLNSNLSVSAYPVYFAQTGDQLGRGPLPPRVGKETKYWIFVKMVNDINDVNNVTVSAELPFNVSWNDKTNVPVGDPIEYDAAAKALSWRVSMVPVRPSNIGFAFEVGIIPTAGQKGTYPLLLTNLKVRGTDKSTGREIVKELGGVTTRLLYDKKGMVKDGVVK